MANILVLDDDISLLEQLEGLLSQLGHNPGFFTRPEYLFKRLESQAFDLILMDIHMPGITGIELLRKIKVHPQFKTLPVIMLTIDPDEQLLKTCFESGAADFINKPVSETILKARVNAVLQIQDSQKKLLLKNRELEKTTRELRQSQHASQLQ